MICKHTQVENEHIITKYNFQSRSWNISPLLKEFYSLIKGGDIWIESTFNLKEGKTKDSGIFMLIYIGTLWFILALYHWLVGWHKYFG